MNSKIIQIFALIFLVNMSQSMTGGYNASPDGESCKEAILKLEDEKRLKYSGMEILKCETQVVAGVNYKITLQNGQSDTFQLTIFRNLQNEYTLNVEIETPHRKDEAY